MKKAAVPYLVIMVTVGVIVVLITFVAVQVFMCGAVQALDDLFVCGIGSIVFKQGYTLVERLQDVFIVEIDENSFDLHYGTVLSDADMDDFVNELISRGEIEPGSDQENWVRSRLQDEFNYLNPTYTLTNVGARRLAGFPLTCVTDTSCGLEYEDGNRRILYSLPNFKGNVRTFSDVCKIVPVIERDSTLLENCPNASFFAEATHARACDFIEKCNGEPDPQPDPQCEAYTNNFDIYEYEEFGTDYHLSPVEYSVDSVSSTIEGSIIRFNIFLKAVDNIFAEPSTNELHVYTPSGIVKRECVSPIRPVYFFDCDEDTRICTKQSFCNVTKTDMFCNNVKVLIPAVPGECDSTNNEKVTDVYNCGVFKLLLVHNGNNQNYIENILDKVSLKRENLNASFLIDKKTTTQVNNLNIINYIQDNNIDVVVVGSGEGGEDDGNDLSNDFWIGVLRAVKKGEIGLVLTQDVIDGTYNYDELLAEIDYRTIEEEVGIENQGGDDVDFIELHVLTDVPQEQTQVFKEFNSFYKDIWGYNLFTLLTIDSQVSGGVLIEGDIIYKGNSPADDSEEYYLTTKNYGNGRIVVDQIGHVLTQQYIDGHPVEVEIFVTAILWASKKVGGVESPQYSVCGDGVCEFIETPLNCPADCITECTNGIDDDGDGAIDMADAGCSDITDDDETNCGDGVCEGWETPASCTQDCGCGSISCDPWSECIKDKRHRQCWDYCNSWKEEEDCEEPT